MRYKINMYCIFFIKTNKIFLIYLLYKIYLSLLYFKKAITYSCVLNHIKFYVILITPRKRLYPSGTKKAPDNTYQGLSHFYYFIWNTYYSCRFLYFLCNNFLHTSFPC